MRAVKDVNDIKIDPEIANLCRPLTEDEKAQLEANLKADGCIDALKLWDDILLDGHNRLEICKRLGLPFNAERIEIKDRSEAVNWVISNQLGRRNLIPEDASYLRGKRYEAEKIKPEEHRKRFDASRARATVMGLAARGLTDAAEKLRKREGIDLGGQNDPRDQTAVRLGRELGVGDKTIKRDAAFAAAVDAISNELGKPVADLIRTGRAGLPKKAIVAFSKEPGMAMDKFNDLRFEHQKRQAARVKEHKKSAPKHAPLSQLKRAPSALDTTEVERMRPFMNALIQIATTPVTAKTLASDRWPSAWRKQILESLPPALAFLKAFEQEFTPEGDG